MILALPTRAVAPSPVALLGVSPGAVLRCERTCQSFVISTTAADNLSGVVGGDCSSMRIQDPVADAGWLGPERRGRFASVPT